MPLLIIEKLNIDKPFHNVPSVVTQLFFAIVFLIVGWYIPKSYLFAGIIFFIAGASLVMDLLVVRVAGGWENINP